MGIEIERKFLVINNNYKKLSSPFHCAQGYICENPLTRIRIINDKSYITLKGINQGIRRSEYEYEIPILDAKNLLDEFCENPIIEKNRYKILITNTLWEVDEFLGDNLGLVVAEVELKNENDTFDKPDWIGEEVSYEDKYFNHNLVNNPFSKWVS